MLRRDITKLSYKPSDIRKNIKSDDFWKFRLNPDEIDVMMKTIAEDFAVSNCDIRQLNIQLLGHRKIFTMGTIYDTLTIRRTNEVLKKTFLFSTFSRDEEIRQIWKIIETEKDNSFVFRTDIKSFFKDIPFDKVANDLFTKNFITKTTYNHLVKIFQCTSSHGYNGLPMGLPISSSLCEYVLNDFDKSIRNINSCFYYSRYVDDIIFFTTEKIDGLRDQVEEYLPYDLKLNDNKTFYEKIGSDKRIEFLGYSFPLSNVNHTNISIKKINKVKKRIMLSLNHFFSRNNDFGLLLDRLRFLSGNTKLKMAGRKNPIMVGFRYQYLLCDKNEIVKQLKILDTFFRSILHSKKYYLSKILSSRLTDSQKEQLKRISFVSGYEKKITHFYNRTRVSRIKDAWRYE